MGSSLCFPDDPSSIPQDFPVQVIKHGGENDKKAGKQEKDILDS